MSAFMLPVEPVARYATRQVLFMRIAKAVLFFSVVLALGSLACGQEEGLRITKLEPKSGTYLGGDTVTIFGSGFQAEGARDVIVYFGTNKAKVLAFDGDTKLRVQAPSGTKGKTVEITLIFGDSRKFSYPDAYTFIEPSGIKVDDLVEKEKKDGK